MGKARNRAERTGDMDVVIGTTKLVPDASGDLEVKDASNNRKKVIASEIKLGSGNDVVIIKRNSSTGAAQFQTSSDGGSSTTEQSVGGATTVTNPSDLNAALKLSKFSMVVFGLICSSSSNIVILRFFFTSIPTI